MSTWSGLVTGGSSGLGLAVARELLLRGAHVVAADLTSRTVEHPESPGGGAAVFLVADVRDDDQIAQAVESAVDVAPLRVLVTCAGVATPGRVLTDSGIHSLAAFDQVVSINLGGTFNAIRHAAHSMRDNDVVDGDRGVIVMTASVAAFDGQIGQAAYAASKGAIAAMVLPLARDLAEHRIRVMAIAPGMFDTPLLAGLPSAAIRSLTEQVPHPSRFGDPHEFADLVGHILDNKMLNGETIRLDGAIRMAPR